MPRPVTSAVAITTLLGLLLALGSAASQETPGPEAIWRAMFKRPAILPAPPDNPITPEKVALGARLFADTRLSGRNDRSCASCHQPERAFTDGRRRARGISGAQLRRNTPSLWNLAWGKSYFWDGRAPSLEAQVQMPIETADEMGGDWPTILRRLEEDADTAGQFRGAFADPLAVTQVNVLKSLASYVRSLVSPPTPFDAWIEGDLQALSPAQLRGFRLFTGKAQCLLCHVGWSFTDDKFHDIGLRSPDGGRSLVPGGTPGLMAFKTPSLRELARTAPYMHDGSLATLADVVRHYTGGFVRRPSLAPSLRRDLRLSALEKSDLIDFLLSLSGRQNPAHEKKRAGSP